MSNTPLPTPTNQDIEAVIQMATSGRGGPTPTRDTRTQLFVGNVCPRFEAPQLVLIRQNSYHIEFDGKI